MGIQAPLIVFTIAVAVVGAYRFVTALTMEMPLDADQEILEQLTKERSQQLLEGGGLLVAGILGTIFTLYRMIVAMMKPKPELDDESA